MKIRALTYTISAIVLGILVLANLQLLGLPIRLSVLFAQVQVPLGVFLLVIVALIVLIDLGTHALARRSWRQDRLALTQQLDALRARADDTEAARLVQLQALMQREFSAIRLQLDQVSAATTADNRPTLVVPAAPVAIDASRSALRQA